MSVTARQLETRTNYLMQTEPGAIQAAFHRWSNFNWSVDNVIRKFGIDARDLGIVAHVAKEGNAHEQKITPVIYCADCPARLRIASYELLVRSVAYEFSSVSYSVLATAGTKPRVCYFTVDKSCLSSPPKWQEPIEVGTLMRLKIDSPPSAGWVEVTVKLNPADRSKREDGFTVRFFHQPVFPDTYDQNIRAKTH